MTAERLPAAVLPLLFVTSLPTSEEALHSLVREACRRAIADRDEYWKTRISEVKCVVRQAVKLHLPQAIERDPAIQRFVNALYGGLVRCIGPL